MADLPVFVKTPNCSFATLQTGANIYECSDTTILANQDVFKKVFTAGDSGSLIYSASIQPNATNVAHVVRIAVKDPQRNDGVLIYEQTVAATTNSTTAALTKYDVQFNMKLQAGFELWAWLSTTVAGSVGVLIYGGQY